LSHKLGMVGVTTLSIDGYRIGSSPGVWRSEYRTPDTEGTSSERTIG
jgi:hypothetical protein